MDKTLSVRTQVIENIKDEYSGFINYMKLAKDNAKYCALYIEMAIQELHHAETLEEIADDMNICIADDNELNDLINKAKEVYEEA